MSATTEVEALLDEFHAAAAAADEDRYLATLSPTFVFMGTAPGERWEAGAFRDFVHSYFARGIGWTYVASNRHVRVASGGETAWFDETVSNEHYGSCRGTGVLRRSDAGWLLEQYNLTIPIPDSIAGDVVAKIREPA